MEEKKIYTYSYSAAENNEIKRIREKYEPKSKEISKIEQLRKLDESVSKSSAIISITIGIIGTLLFGAGMSFIMVWADTLFGAGIVIGGIGILIAASAYPVYQAVLDKKRKKIAPMILSLSDEILKK